MKPVTNLRILLIAAVALVSIILTIPTVRYYSHLSEQNLYNPILQKKPDAPAPPEATDTVKYTQWATKYPEAAAWYKKNTAALEWEKKDEALREKAIPLGLDLLGGVDVVLRVDPNKAIQGDVDRLRMSVIDSLEKQKIQATADMVKDQPAFTLKLANKADSRKAANILQDYKNSLTGDFTDAALAAGAVTFTMPTDQAQQKLSGTMDGVRKAISERVNALGVTQPRISRVGDTQIRVQVPGVKDPIKLINTVIKPAALEFRLVNPRNSELIDSSTGKLKPGATLPPGTELFTARDTRTDKKTGELVSKTYDIILADKPVLTGRDIRSATVDYDSQKMDIVVDLVLGPEGARIFGDVTAKNQGHQLAIVLDNIVRSHPNINEAIRGGRAQISGGFTNEEATELSQVLKAGALPADLEIESNQTVGASLGGDSIASGVKALVIGTIVVSAFMIVYYSTAGVISIIALILNVLIILAIMALSRATLTLSGIGGILLTIGMAVDANVLIYERIREELRNGRPMRQAIGLGFNRAFAVILDSNLTTLLTALVLLQFTEGSVFGFALTTTFGLIANLFTGLTVTYTICALWFSWRGHLSLGKMSIFHSPNFDFIKARLVTIPGSWIVIMVCLVLVWSQGGLKMGVDFAGGMRQEIAFEPDKPVKIEDLRKTVEEAKLPDVRVQEILGKKNTYLIDVGLLKTTDPKISDLTYTGQVLDGQLAAKYSNPDKTAQYKVSAAQGFGSETASGFTWLALTVIILSAIAEGIYLWFRFELAFGVAAVIALVHDLLMVALICTLWKVQISLDAVAAFMVLMGFSVNDTIVIFDRIRENTRTVFGKDFGELCNMSMNQSLSRTIITSGTVFLASLVLLLVGGEGLSTFAKIITVGAIVGTYSSDFIAAPLVYEWNRFKGNRLAVALASKKKRVEAAKPIGRPTTTQRPGTAK
ncbi:protein translocase subunit SecD [bacterium]|nr:protein translocase subunit SecD [bacterium]